jgi:hypothetical protein
LAVEIADGSVGGSGKVERHSNVIAVSGTTCRGAEGEVADCTVSGGPGDDCRDSVSGTRWHIAAKDHADALLGFSVPLASFAAVNIGIETGSRPAQTLAAMMVQRLLWAMLSRMVPTAGCGDAVIRLVLPQSGRCRSVAEASKAALPEDT